jgi:hypothetical protein
MNLYKYKAFQNPATLHRVINYSLHPGIFDILGVGHGK